MFDDNTLQNQAFWPAAALGPHIWIGMRVRRCGEKEGKWRSARLHNSRLIPPEYPPLEIICEIHSLATRNPWDGQLITCRRDDAVHGLVLFPVLSSDPNHLFELAEILVQPAIILLTQEITTLFMCSLYSFLDNASVLGPTVYVVPWSERFSNLPGTASGLISFSHPA